MKNCPDYSMYNDLWLKGNYFIQVEAYYFKAWINYDMDFHSHNGIEIMYVINGSCVVEAGEGIIKMKAGELILIDSNISHKLTVSKNNSCRMLNIEFTFNDKEILLPSLRQLADSVEAVKLLFMSRENYILLKDSGDVYPILKSVIIELGKKSIDSVFLQQLLLDQLIIKISQLYQEAQGKDEGNTSIYIKKAKNYIACNYDYDISVQDIAKCINIHPGYLHRIFKKNTGNTIIEYLNNMRIEKAKMLLSNTEIPVTDISSYVGINSLQYFTFLFKKNTNITPLQYRKSISIINFRKS